MVTLDVDVRRGKVYRYHLEDVRVRDRRVIKTRSVDQRDGAPEQLEGIGCLNFGCAGFQASSDSKTRAADSIDELKASNQYFCGNIMMSMLRTVDLPEPVAPMTL